MKSRNQGFTLIELLVVIAIIAILAAILFPVFAKAREKARMTSCLSNEKQLALGIAQYSQDYDEKFPNSNWPSAPPNNAAAPEGWGGEVYPYVKSAGVYTCPDDPTTGLHCSYSFNENLINGNTGGNGVLNSVNAPASTVLLYEVGNFPADVTNPQEGGSPTGTIGDCCDGWTRPNPPNYYTATGFVGNPPKNNNWNNTLPQTPRHNDGANYAMTDGHAKFLRPASVSPGYNAANPSGVQGGVNVWTPACGTGNLGSGGFQVTFSAQ